MNIPLFDAHCDTIYRIKETGQNLRKNKLHIDLERGGRFSPYAQVFAVFTRPWPEKIDIHNMDYSHDWGAQVLIPMGAELLDLLLAEFDTNSAILAHCLSAQDAKTAAEQGKIAAFIAIEGAELIGCDIDMLHEAFDKGVRLINLCWNYDNALCGAANSGSRKGLTEQGRAYVEQMQSMGIAVDLSHASEETFWDVAAIAKRPIIAGHSNSKAVCNNVRNLSDEQILEIIRLKGAVGLNLCPDFLTAGGAAKFDDILRHIEHFLELGAERALCLGGDLDGIDHLPLGFNGIESYAELFEDLLKRNYPEMLLRDIFYNNFLNVLERVL